MRWREERREGAPLLGTLESNGDGMMVSSLAFSWNWGYKRAIVEGYQVLRPPPPPPLPLLPPGTTTDTSSSFPSDVIFKNQAAGNESGKPSDFVNDLTRKCQAGRPSFLLPVRMPSVHLA